MKILFLDFDGVLNSADYFKSVAKQPTLERPLDHIEPLAVERLNEILTRTGAAVVISSSWRILASFKELTKEMLVPRGFLFSSRVIGETPRKGRQRGDQIRAWLDAVVVDPHDYVVLDDDSDRGSIPRHRWVLTNSATGLMDEHVERAVFVLNERKE